MVIHRLFILSLTCLLGEYCLAGDVASEIKGDVGEGTSASQVIDYEKHVREIAQKTAEEPSNVLSRGNQPRPHPPRGQL